MKLKLFRIIFSNEKLKILDQDFSVEIEYIIDTNQKILYIIHSFPLTTYFILNQNPEKKLEILERIKNDQNIIEKKKYKQLPNIIDKFIERKLFTNEIILYLNDIKNSLLNILNNKDWNNENVELFAFCVEECRENIKIDNKLYNSLLMTKIKIDSKFGQFLFKNIFFFKINKDYYMILPNYISEITEYIINHIEDFYNNCICINQNIRIEKQLFYNNKNFILEHYDCRYNDPQITLFFKDKDESKLVLNFKCRSKKEFYSNINFTQSLIKNKDVILNLLDEHKISVYNYALKLIDEILLNINEFRNKIKMEKF